MHDDLLHVNSQKPLSQPFELLLRLRSFYIKTPVALFYLMSSSPLG
jgi:hypothetical protein